MNRQVLFCSEYIFNQDGSYRKVIHEPEGILPSESKKSESETGTYSVEDGMIIFSNQNNEKKTWDPLKFFHPEEDRCSA
ncbi:MAG: hypothetical protein OEZ34_14160 [Spirochaetia bacterium]|nr:hypothetical protein [Spirochaetia bacterium]